MKESILQVFLAALRFNAGLVGTFLIGGALANLTQGRALGGVVFAAALGFVGVIIWDPRGNWSGFVAGIIGSFGLFGLISIIPPLQETHAPTRWSDVSAWRLTLYAMCLGGFLFWCHRRSVASSLE